MLATEKLALIPSAVHTLSYEVQTWTVIELVVAPWEVWPGEINNALAQAPPVKVL